VAKNRSKQNQKCPVVGIRHVATVDSDARISHAIDMLLQAAAEAKSQSKGISAGKKETPHG
jgi:hypothetical protein